MSHLNGLDQVSRGEDESSRFLYQYEANPLQGRLMQPVLRRPVDHQAARGMK